LPVSPLEDVSNDAREERLLPDKKAAIRSEWKCRDY